MRRVNGRGPGARNAGPPKPRAAQLGRSEETAIAVDTAVEGVASVLRRRFGRHLWFRGELVQLTTSRGGHGFAVLKGQRTKVTVHLPPALLHRAASPPPGTVVLVRGDVRLWVPAGSFRIEAVTSLLVTDTEGSRAQRRRATERRLREDGVFERRKRPVPLWPDRVAVVTSPSGAAIDDVRAVARRRAPWVSVELHACAVQGTSAPDSIAQALASADASEADVIVMTRGGGGADDLDAFDDIKVVRAVARCQLSVISAIGHDRDSTLSDKAADASVSTPSAAAELAVPDKEMLRSRLDNHMRRIDQEIARALDAQRGRLRQLVDTAQTGTRRAVEIARAHRSRFRRAERRAEAEGMIRAYRGILDRTNSSAKRDAYRRIRFARDQVSRFRGKSHSIRARRILRAQRENLDNRLLTLTKAIDSRLRKHRRLSAQWTAEKLLALCIARIQSSRAHAAQLFRTVEALSPRRVLHRGYAIVLMSGQTVRAAADVQEGDRLEIILENGAVNVVVEHPQPATAQGGSDE